MRHLLVNKDPENKTAFCVACDQVVRIRRKGYQVNGTVIWRCVRKDNLDKAKRNNLKDRPYLKFKREVCEKCGFMPEHSSQLDVDHIDGNHSNNEMSNLQTLCANCHRLKTYMERRGTPSAFRC